MKTAIARILRSLAERIEPTPRVGLDVPLGWTGYLTVDHNASSVHCAHCGQPWSASHACSWPGTFTYNGPLAPVNAS